MTDNHLASNGQKSQHKPLVSIYWDCQNVPIKNPYLAKYLLAFASQRGDLVCKKAYANWRLENPAAEQRLYQLGFDCIDVPLKEKNSVDKKIIDDCITNEVNLSSDIYIFVTGDGDFAGPVEQLKAKGKKVIIFSQSNASKKLIKLGDEQYFVDKLPDLMVERIQERTTSGQCDLMYNEASDYLIEAIKTALSKGKPTVLGFINKLMCELFPTYKGASSICTADGKKFSSFSKFVKAVEKEGKVRIENEELFLIYADKLAA